MFFFSDEKLKTVSLKKKKKRRDRSQNLKLVIKKTVPEWKDISNDCRKATAAGLQSEKDKGSSGVHRSTERIIIHKRKTFKTAHSLPKWQRVHPEGQTVQWAPSQTSQASRSKVRGHDRTTSSSHLARNTRLPATGNTLPTPGRHCRSAVLFIVVVF